MVSYGKKIEQASSASELQILTLFIDNYNAFNQKGKYGRIYEAAFYGHTEIVRILAPLTDNPNAPDENGNTPINMASRYGYIEFVNVGARTQSSKQKIHLLGMFTDAS